MKKTSLLCAKAIICAMMVCLFTVPYPALANIWNLPNGLMDLFDSNITYSGYTVGSCDPKTRAGNPSELAVFIMTSAVHDELFICRESSDHSWEIELQSSAAVYQPTEDGNLHPKIDIIDNSMFRISYENSTAKETYDFAFQNDQWLLFAAEIAGASEKLTCRKTDEGLQILTVSDLTYDISNITLNDFNILRFPKSEEQLKQWQIALNKIVSKLPQAIIVEGTSKKTFPVYTGPTKKSYRAGNKKAAISLKEPYRVYGTHDNWTMVEYEISAKSKRIGWIEQLSLSTNVPSIDWAPVVAVTISPAALTDDPHVGQTSIVTVPGTSNVNVLACLDPWWAYISVVIRNNQYYGFIPLDILQVE